jgi:hypothetical protein
LHRWSLCTGRRGHAACAACWFVPERNQHQGADGNCRVDDRWENPCPCGWCARLGQQVTESAEAEYECARTDVCNSADRPAVNPAGCSRTDGESDAVHSREQNDGRYCAAPIWTTMRGMYDNTAPTGRGGRSMRHSDWFEPASPPATWTCLMRCCLVRTERAWAARGFPRPCRNSPTCRRHPENHEPPQFRLRTNASMWRSPPGPCFVLLPGGVDLDAFRAHLVALARRWHARYRPPCQIRVSS